MLKARQRLAKLQQQVAAGTFTTPAVILAKAKKAVGRTHDLHGVFTFALPDTPAGKRLEVQESATAMQDERDLQGVYLLRTTDNSMSAEDVWRTYMLLTRVEAAFRNLKTDLSIRPIFHHKENRGDAHVLFSVLAYALAVTIQLRHRQHGGTLTTARCWRRCSRWDWPSCLIGPATAVAWRSSVPRCRRRSNKRSWRAWTGRSRPVTCPRTWRPNPAV